MFMCDFHVRDKLFMCCVGGKQHIQLHTGNIGNISNIGNIDLLQDAEDILVQSNADCFPITLVPSLNFPLWPYEFPINYAAGNSFLQIHKIILDEGNWTMEVTNKFPFAIIKYLNENFDAKNEFKCGNSLIKVIKPNWIK